MAQGIQRGIRKFGKGLTAQSIGPAAEPCLTVGVCQPGWGLVRLLETGLMNPSAQDLLPMRNRLVTGVLTFGRCATDLSSLLNIYRHASPMIGRLGQRSSRT